MKMSGRAHDIPWAAILWQLSGFALAIACWQLWSQWFLGNQQFRDGFGPSATFKALTHLMTGGFLRTHVVASLQRVTTGLAFAIMAGVPLGILTGHFRRFNQLFNGVFQFVRMTSPLAWMPIAIIMFGVGDRPVGFLVAVAAVWPIMLSTAHGVRNVEPIWLRVARMLGASRWQALQRVVFRAMIPDMLTGLRISVGIAWIVLVPAEMLGVSSGLGYYILDTRDRFNYAELMAVILIVGFLGFLSDAILRFVQQSLSWRELGEPAPA